MSVVRKRLPVFERVQQPPGYRLTRRDSQILQAIHAFDGMLADYQIQRLFFTSLRRAQARLTLLYQNGFLSRPDRKQRAALPRMVYFLARRGAEHVAGLSGETLSEFTYRDELKRIGVEHDLAVTDFRLDVLEACRTSPHLTLEQWVSVSEFWADPDTVWYTGTDGSKRKRQIRPDGAFVIREPGYTSRFLLEVDMATEDNPRFVREKVRPALAYVGSGAYQRRFGYRSGRYLVVTTTEQRLRNLKRATELAGGPAAKVFHFTLKHLVRPHMVLTGPIWWRGGEETPRPLLQATP